jgi:hypothetical protein
MRRCFRLFGLVMLTGLFLGCSGSPALKAIGSPTRDTGPRVSFSAPESGASLPLGPVQVLLLSEDPLGTAQVEVLVGGATAASIPSPDKTKPSVVVEYAWQPPAPGAYTLQARGQNTAGTWGAFAQLSLTVTEPEPGETATFEPSGTSTPTIAPTESPTALVATTTPTFTLNPLETTPLPPIPGLSFTWEFSTYYMYKYGSACEPQKNGVFVKVSGIDLETIGGVMLFFQPMDKKTHELWTWTTGLWLENATIYRSEIYDYLQVATCV